MARSYTPTSIESPLPLPKTVVKEKQDPQTLLRDYALGPPSQRLQLHTLSAPYTASIRRLLKYGGYPQITEGEDRTGRAVLFWVDGSQPTTYTLEQELGADGRERGMLWKSAVKLLEPLPKIHEKAEEGEDLKDEQEAANMPGMKSQTRRTRKWIITFEDENEAWSFVRAWHCRSFPSATGDEPALARAEMLW